MTIDTSIPKYKCACGWKGNTPKNVEFELDGMLEVCPECEEVVMLNWNNPNVQLRFLKVYFEVQRNFS